MFMGEHFLNKVGEQCIENLNGFIPNPMLPDGVVEGKTIDNMAYRITQEIQRGKMLFNAKYALVSFCRPCGDPGPNGHEVAIAMTNNNTFILFDPNYGEYEFPNFKKFSSFFSSFFYARYTSRNKKFDFRKRSKISFWS
ncbi:hypothetical protein GCM10007877_06650 [Marinibactrum halimedae]|uniref:Peptidase C58 YopT-type domain-containing protein n=1 Tax=Marinibactrum halimedae TaxID=1444977 RepID=A0AA37WMF1_9GAMM|nr:hypothetical protein GCM10007877_06650 [Marinibactrum halimedae]